MRPVTERMLQDLNDSMSKGGSRGDISSEIWRATWRFHDRRIEDKVRDHVLIFHHIHIHELHRSQGHFTDLLQTLDERPELLGRRLDWIYLEQVNYRLAGHLERELLYKSDFGMVIDCWRRVTGQLEMKL